jgi:methionyl-tRNA synthetase
VELSRLHPIVITPPRTNLVFPLQNVELVQFMGKDNVPFHTVIFPATLLGTKVGTAGQLGTGAWADC